MEEALQPLEADQQTSPNRHLALGISASVLLHLICSAVLLGLPQGSQAPPSVTYIDLGMPRQASPVPPQKQEALPEKAALKAEMPLVPETPIAPEAPAQAQESKAAPKPPAATRETAVEEQRPRSTLGLGLTKGYFKSLGDGETLRPGIRNYYLDMLQGINEKWWLDQQVDKAQIRTIVVNIVVARNGDIVNSAIVTSSGNAGYDKAVQAALTAASPLPPLPEEYEGDFFMAPIRLVPPLNLMAW